MNILILNGSPKGENSITYQHVEYLKHKYPEHLYKTINVGSRIRSIEKDFSESKADLKMNYIKGLSADMEDLLSKKGRKEAKDFFKYVLWNIKNGFAENAFMAPPMDIKLHSASLPKNSSIKTNKKIALVTDIDTDNKVYHNLDTMIKRFVNRYPGEVNVINQY